MAVKQKLHQASVAEFHLVFSPWALWIFVSITKQLVNIYSDHRKLVICAELDKSFRILTTACKLVHVMSV